VRFPFGLELTGGARFGYGESLEHGVAGEAFASVALVPHFWTLHDDFGVTGAWRPAVGFEVGYTTARRQFPTTTAPESSARLDSQAAPGYFEFLARPARFRLSNFNATVLGLGFGTPFAAPGAKLRVQIEVLQVGLIL
jgi:hypothetical protein